MTANRNRWANEVAQGLPQGALHVPTVNRHAEEDCESGLRRL